MRAGASRYRRKLRAAGHRGPLPHPEGNLEGLGYTWFLRLAAGARIAHEKQVELELNYSMETTYDLTFLVAVKSMLDSLGSKLTKDEVKLRDDLIESALKSRGFRV